MTLHPKAQGNPLLPASVRPASAISKSAETGYAIVQFTALLSGFDAKVIGVIEVISAEAEF